MDVDDPQAYSRVIDGAREDVLVIAARRGLPPEFVAVSFDAGRGAGPHSDHVLTISTLDQRLSMEERGIPHQWLVTMGTGYIDKRFVRLVTALLFRFEKKAEEMGIRF